MSVVVEHHDPAAGHSRPRIVSFTGSEGRLDVHCDRSDGSLWLFAVGPRGGERGRVAFPVTDAPRLLQWAEVGGEFSIAKALGVLRVKDAEEGWATVEVGKYGRWGLWSMRMEPPAWAEFVTCVREWAAAVVRVGAA